MSIKRLLGPVLGVALSALPGAVLAQQAPATGSDQDPLTAIDWLSRPPELVVPQASRPATPAVKPRPSEPPVTTGAARPAISVQPLDAATPDAAGLLPPSVTGFPVDLWHGTGVATLDPILGALDTSASPVMQRLLMQLLLAEANPPLGVGEAGAFVALRAAKLESLGAVDQALALVERAGIDGPALFDVYFDLALLTDQTDAACEILAKSPHLAQDYAARVFCLARAGDWQAAATTRNSAALLGGLSDEAALLLELFLDPELAEELDPPSVPRKPTPLEVRLFEALGQTIPAENLSAGHAVRDLGGDRGWRAQIAAAERLTARGALDPARLFAIYTERKPSASGGIWDRAAAIQRLTRALDTGRDAAAGAALIKAWPLMRDARLDGPFATHFAPDLLNADLDGPARDLAIEVGLLSLQYEAAAAGLPTGQRAFVAALAQGDGAAMADVARSNTETALAQAFATPALPPALERLRDEDKLGELILRAMALYLAGQTGDVREASDAIATFRAVGLEDVARRAALEVLLLDRGA